MITTILFTIWITMVVIFCSKEWADSYARGYMLFDVIIAPVAIVMDIIQEWKNNRTNGSSI